MKKLLLLSLIAISSLALNRPPNLDLEANKKAVFVDFKNINYNITYDIRKRVVEVTSTIEFVSLEDGMPIFDLVPNPYNVIIDGKDTTINTTSMNGNSKIRYVNQSIRKGSHTITMTNKITNLVKYGFFSTSVSSAFWMSDLSDRKYIEKYLPTNLEYDHYKSSMEVKINGTRKKHIIYNNGEIKELGFNHYKIDYPKYFTASSTFFHLVPSGKFNESRGTFKSVDGRILNVITYGKSTENFLNKTIEILTELEADYGPWPHASVTVYAAGQGGMEYSGATRTSATALGHELTHSYFARGVMPARGNSGWIDEAMASWRDSNYKQVPMGYLKPKRMAGYSVYRRHTDRAAYTSGRDFLAHLDKVTQDQGGLKKFMKFFKEKRLFKPVLTSDLVQDLQEYFNMSFESLFDKYIYGKGYTGSKSSTDRIENPYHPTLSEEEELKLL